MRLGDSKKIQDIIFTVQKGGIGGSGTFGDPWQTTTGPGETQTVTAPTGGQGQGDTTTGVPFLKLEVSSTSENNSNEAVFSVNGQERFRSTTGGGFSSRIELGDSISFSTEGGESNSFAWSFYIEPDPSSSSSSTETPVPTSTPTPTPTPSAVDYDTTITVPSDSNKINGNGVTLVSLVGNSISYNNLIDFAGTPFNILVYISNVQVALITITNPYIGKPFRFTTNSGDSYEATFEMDGRIDF